MKRGCFVKDMESFSSEVHARPVLIHRHGEGPSRRASSIARDISGWTGSSMTTVSPGWTRSVYDEVHRLTVRPGQEIWISPVDAP
ncbi:MAG: hypothetical protein ACLUEU_01080 [Oscillospiraceae bacterium]